MLDISEALARGNAPERHPLALRVAFQESCHLGHAQKVREQPRALLRSIPGLELVEPAEQELCCGSAGIYNLVQPEAARELGDRKAAQVLATGPDLYVSANPGCLLQVSAALRRAGHPLPAAHPVELLDASIRGVAPPEPALADFADGRLSAHGWLQLRRRPLRGERAARKRGLVPLHPLPAPHRRARARSRGGSPRGRSASSRASELLRAFEPPDGFAKVFCSACGSSLWSRSPDGETVSVRFGVFDSDPGIRAGYRQFVAYFPAWDELPDDGLPRFAERRPPSV